MEFDKDVRLKITKEEKRCIFCDFGDGITRPDRAVYEIESHYNGSILRLCDECFKDLFIFYQQEVVNEEQKSKTAREIYDEMTDVQKKVLHYLAGIGFMKKE